MPQRIFISLSQTWEKTFPYFAYLGGALIAFLAPINDLLLFAGFTILLDLITGSWAAIKRKEKFDSKKLSRSWAKVILYPSGIIFSHWAETLAPEVPFVKGATYLLIVIEGKSLEENFSDILGFSMVKYIKVLILKGRKGLLQELHDEKEAKK